MLDVFYGTLSLHRENFSIHHNKTFTNQHVLDKNKKKNEILLISTATKTGGGGKGKKEKEEEKKEEEEEDERVFFSKRKISDARGRQPVVISDRNIRVDLVPNEINLLTVVVMQVEEDERTTTIRF